MLENKKIGFIGVGNMANAMINGIFGAGKPLKYTHLFLNDIDTEKMNNYADKGANICFSPVDVVKNCDYIVLSVKPQNLTVLAQQLQTIKGIKNKIFVSIMAGISTTQINDVLGGVSIVRAMPNTPMLIGMGVSVICKNNAISSEDFENVCSIFKASGNIFIIDESQMNEIIGVTASSPAYVFKLIDAMCNGALSQGFDYNDVFEAICDVVIGSASLAKQSGKTPSELISIVASKGGTTERALLELDSYKFEEGIVSAMKKCTSRAYELGEKK